MAHDFEWGEETAFSLSNWESIISQQVETIDSRKREYTRWTAAAITGIGVAIFVFLDTLARAGLRNPVPTIVLLAVVVYLAVRMGVVLLQPFVTSALAILLATITVPRGPTEAAASFLAIGETSARGFLKSPILTSAGVTLLLFMLDFTSSIAQAGTNLRLAWVVRTVLFVVFIAVLIPTRRRARKLLPGKDEFLKQAGTRFSPRGVELVALASNTMLIGYYLIQLDLVGGTWIVILTWSQESLLLLVFGLAIGALLVWARITWSIVAGHSTMLREWEGLHRRILTGELQDPSKIQQAIRELVPSAAR